MKNQILTVRPYNAATDLPTLLDIWFEASLRAHPFLGEHRLREERILMETEYLPKSENWVACDQGEPIGFIGLLDTFVGGLFIAPAHQGKGAGRLLTAHALELKGRLELEVYTDNQQAYAFYEKLGFREVSRRRTDDHGLPFENARMRLTG
ncbi:acetyltransferase, GNAT family [Hyphomonas neptunium ATCC 15444]|uniref:Acetyltransferase, GNAT family n=2 Tax=Hyphomonas TaxID=85 RepID=Q0BZX7_HYPNA|nr:MULTISPECIES: GNAT family N-acetyltransferase [Hyphomonas]ABI75681.1 acetyltransferase, GNAT family [Hyphomonas neptunium ATCC 15444]